MMGKAKKFQNVIYITWDDCDDQTSYMLAHKNHADAARLGEQVNVGIYQLVAVRKLVTKSELVQ